jgi:hypothetical protein
MEAKPICVIYLPEHWSFGNMDRDGASELMKALNGGFGNDDNRVQYTDYWKEYYWFCFTKYDIEAPEFKVFHAKDFTEIQFNELKDLIMADLESMKTPVKNDP